MNKPFYINVVKFKIISIDHLDHKIIKPDKNGL